MERPSRKHQGLSPPFNALDDDEDEGIEEVEAEEEEEEEEDDDDEGGIQSLSRKGRRLKTLYSVKISSHR